MKQNNQILLLIAGIVIVLYTFLSLQFLLGLIAVSVIVVALIVLPSDEQ